MKTSFLALAVCIVSTFATQAQWVGGFASFWDTDEFGDTYGGGVVGHWQVHELIAIEGRGAWYMDTSGPPGEEIEPASLGIGPALTIAMNEQWTGYGSVVGSLFMFARDVEIDGNNDIDDEGADFGLTVTGGLRTQLQSSWSLLAEAFYNIVPVDTKNVRDGEIVYDEIDLDGFGINLGFGYSW